MEGNGLRQAIHITLRGRYNITYSGTLILHGNITSRLAPVEDVSSNKTNGEEGYDATGASYYVIAVVLVYGMSIVALIASHIKRRQDKITEDKQIDKYLQDFQIIKEVHARDSYKNLKKSVMNKINWDRKKDTHRTLQKSILPLLAIGMQVGAGSVPVDFPQQDAHHKGKRKVYPIGAKRHSDPDISDSTKLIEVSDSRPLRVRRHSYIDQPYVHQDCSGMSLHLLTIPDGHFPLAGVHLTPATAAGGPPGGGSAHQPLPTDSASARRLRFSTSNTSVSRLDRSLNSIAEREEDEERDLSLDVPVTKLRRIGVGLPPSADSFPDHAPIVHRPSVVSVAVHENEGEHKISVHIDDVDAWETPADASSHNSSLCLSDEDDSTPVMLPLTSYPVSIMVEADDDDDDLDDPDVMFRDPDEVYFEEDEEPKPPRRRTFGEEIEECKFSPQTLLASIKFTGGTLNPHTSPHRSRSASITSLLSRRNSKDRRRSTGRDPDGLTEVADEVNPHHITCL